MGVVGEQSADALVELVEFCGEVQRQAGFDGDVLGQVRVIQLVTPGLEGFGCDGQQLLGFGLAPGAAGVAVEESGQAGSAEAEDLVRVGVVGQEQQCGLVMFEPSTPTQAGLRTSSSASNRAKVVSAVIGP